MTHLGYVQQSDSQVFLNMSSVYGLEYTLNFFNNMYWYYNQYNAFALNMASIPNETLQTVSPTPAQDIPPLDYFDFDMFDDNEDNECVVEKCDDKEHDKCVKEKCDDISQDDNDKSSDDVYSCRYCGLTYASTDGARKHCRKHHPILMESVTRGKPDQYCVRVVKKK